MPEFPTSSFFMLECPLEMVQMDARRKFRAIAPSDRILCCVPDMVGWRSQLSTYEMKFSLGFKVQRRI